MFHQEYLELQKPCCYNYTQDAFFLCFLQTYASEDLVPARNRKNFLTYHCCFLSFCFNLSLILNRGSGFYSLLPYRRKMRVNFYLKIIKPFWITKYWFVFAAFLVDILYSEGFEKRFILVILHGDMSWLNLPC